MEGHLAGLIGRQCDSLILQRQRQSETDKEPYWLSVLKLLKKRGFIVSPEVQRESKQEVQGPEMALEG